MASDSQPPDDVRRALQARVDAALRETPDLHAASTYAEFGPPASDDLLGQLTAVAGDPAQDLPSDRHQAAARMAAVLDECAQLAATDAVDPIALRRALAAIVMHHPAAVALGLRLPALGDSAPWLTVPSRR